MALNKEASINFRVTEITKDIALNVCGRNEIKKHTDLHRMAYMLGMEIIMEIEKKKEAHSDLMTLLAYEVSKRAKKRIS